MNNRVTRRKLNYAKLKATELQEVGREVEEIGYAEKAKRLLLRLQNGDKFTSFDSDIWAYDGKIALILNKANSKGTLSFPLVIEWQTTQEKPSINPIDENDLGYSPNWMPIDKLIERDIKHEEWFDTAYNSVFPDLSKKQVK